MTQVEIAKKILRQGNCQGIICKKGCPFYDKITTGWNTNCMIWIRNKNNTFNRDMDAVKQWLKEQEREMIDLTKEQVFTEPVRAWVWNYDVNGCDYRWVIGARRFGDGMHYSCLMNLDGNKEITKEDIAYTPRRDYRNCSLTDPNKPKFKRWLKIEDVPVELWGRALYKRKDEPISSGDILCPCKINYDNGYLANDLVYLPLGQPLDSEWLEMGEWV